MLTLKGGVPKGFGLGKALGVGHLLGLGELAAYVGTPRLLHAHAPAAKATSGDAVTKDKIPAGFVAVAGRAFRARAKAVNLAVKINLFWWL
jgi:hypothetical protein